MANNVYVQETIPSLGFFTDTFSVCIHIPSNVYPFTSILELLPLDHSLGINLHSRTPTFLATCSEESIFERMAPCWKQWRQWRLFTWTVAAVLHVSGGRQIGWTVANNGQWTNNWLDRLYSS